MLKKSNLTVDEVIDICTDVNTQRKSDLQTLASTLGIQPNQPKSLLCKDICTEICNRMQKQQVPVFNPPAAAAAAGIGAGTVQGCSVGADLGSGPGAFKKNYSLAILYDLSNFISLNKYDNTTPLHKHFTLHIINFNGNNPDVKFFINNGNVTPSFEKAIKDAFDNHLMIDLDPKQGLTKMGVFTAKKYTPTNQLSITNFRKEIYSFIMSKVTLIKGIDNISIPSKFPGAPPANYRVFCSLNGPLYAIQDYYFGTGVWEPHISLYHKSDALKNVNVNVNFHKIKLHDRNRLELSVMT